MALGEAAGVAAALAVREGLPVQDLPVPSIQDRLLDEGASLIWFKDVSTSSPDFKLVQKMALKGYLTGWEARLDEPVSEGGMTRREMLQKLSDKL
jgi:hypothetical protein